MLVNFYMIKLIKFQEKIINKSWQLLTIKTFLVYK